MCCSLERTISTSGSKLEQYARAEGLLLGLFIICWVCPYVSVFLYIFVIVYCKFAIEDNHLC